MAGVTSVTRVFVVDTSYLDEFYGLPGWHDPAHRTAILDRWDQEAGLGARFYVPAPVLFELCNHIAQLPDGHHRHTLAGRVAQDVRDALSALPPGWIVSRSAKDALLDVATLLSSLDAFSTQLAVSKIGLTDAAVIQESRRLKDRHVTSGWPVHIWSKDTALKACEPDQEPSPLDF
jgi:hypothetical protein